MSTSLGPIGITPINRWKRTDWSLFGFYKLKGSWIVIWAHPLPVEIHIYNVHSWLIEGIIPLGVVQTVRSIQIDGAGSTKDTNPLYCQWIAKANIPMTPGLKTNEEWRAILDSGARRMKGCSDIVLERHIPTMFQGTLVRELPLVCMS